MTLSTTISCVCFGALSKPIKSTNVFACAQVTWWWLYFWNIPIMWWQCKHHVLVFKKKQHTVLSWICQQEYTNRNWTFSAGKDHTGWNGDAPKLYNYIMTMTNPETLPSVWWNPNPEYNQNQETAVKKKNLAGVFIWKKCLCIETRASEICHKPRLHLLYVSNTVKHHHYLAELWVCCVCVCVCVYMPVRQYGYAFQAFSWMFRAEDGANILTNDGTLLRDRGVKTHKKMYICLICGILSILIWQNLPLEELYQSTVNIRTIL